MRKNTITSAKRPKKPKLPTNSMDSSANSTYSPLNDMVSLSENRLCDRNVVGLKGSEVSNQAKLFLVSQARHELQRILKYTQFLDDLETKFMRGVDVALLDHPYDLSTITAAMDIISKSLERSNKLVTQILEDENINTLVVNATVISNNNTNIVNAVSGGLDSSSRDQIRQIASTLLQQLQDNVQTEPVVVDTVTQSTEIIDKPVELSTTKN